MSGEQKGKIETQPGAASDKNEKVIPVGADQVPPVVRPPIPAPPGPPRAQTVGTVLGILLVLAFVGSGFLFGWDVVLENAVKPVGIVVAGVIGIALALGVLFLLLVALVMLLLTAATVLARLFGLGRDLANSYYVWLLASRIREWLDLESPDPDAVRISPRAFLRAMVVIAWASFRHPFSTTVIDLSTGEVVREG
jgi:hypothetical protein